MAWSYNDWHSQATAAARLERLRLHLDEVAGEITSNLASGGDSRSNDVLQRFYDRLLKELTRLTGEAGAVDSNDARVTATFIRGRPV